MRDVVHFFEEEYKQQAANKNYQKIASAVDGMKPTARKFIHTLRNIKEFKKVEGVANLTAGETEYLGGASNISGVIVNNTCVYTGSNNLVLSGKKGNFGHRLDTNASEPRYIFVRKGEMYDVILNKVDNNILTGQIFEGTEIEPKFFVPILPMLLINGSNDMGSGHAQNILPRDPANMKKALTLKLQGKKIPEKLFYPHYNGFEGTVEQGETKRQWKFKGKVEVINKKKARITELPPKYTLVGYKKTLEALVEKKAIVSYQDLSNTKTDKYEFIVNCDTSKDLLSTLKLIETISENYTANDENNQIKIFESAEEIFDYYVDVKLRFLQKRKDFIIKDLNDSIHFDASKYLFIKMIVDNELIINKRKKADIEKDLDKVEKILKKDDSYDYLLNMALHSLTEERMKKLMKDIKDQKARLDSMKKTTINDMWLEDLKDL